MSRWTNPSNPSIGDDEDSRSSDSVEVVSTDLIDPFVKNTQFISYKNKHKEPTHEAPRSRSRSYERHRRRKHSRSRSRERSKQRSHSRSKQHRSKRYSRSPDHSRSRSSSYEHRHRSRNKSRRRSRSRSRSRTKRASHKQKSEKGSRRRSPVSDREDPFIDIDEQDNSKKTLRGKVAEDSKDNAFKNDGSFLEVFKKMQEEKAKAAQEAAEAAAATSVEFEEKKAIPFFGKRRGGKILKTGFVAKPKTVEEQKAIDAKDPWSIYLQEVKKYKEATCDDDSKTRPLVK